MNITWNLIPSKKKIGKLNNPILIVGLPGIGNVGKVAADFLIDKTKVETVVDIFSNSFPHSVFVTEDNLVNLPTITLYAKKRGKGQRDLLLLGGDVQPTDEQASYAFAEKILDIVEELGCKEIITLGGIGLPAVPKEPKVYITGNSSEIVSSYAKRAPVERKLYGVVGPIMGVSGLLLGLSKQRKISAVCFLAETYGHPMYLGVKSAKNIVAALNKSLSLSLSVADLEKEIEEIEKENGEGQNKGTPKSRSLKKIQDGISGPTDTNYIG